MTIGDESSHRRRVSVTPVAIVPYDPAWPVLYDREREILARIFAGTRTVIEHVGSTAVPGLGAKPIIDIMAGVTTLQVVERRISRLERVDYEYVQEYEAELPERRYFRKPRIGSRNVHLHCVINESAFWRRHLAFRDYLRSHAEAADEYYNLKRTLAERFGDRRSDYTRAKTSFIESILRKALSG